MPTPLRRLSCPGTLRDRLEGLYRTYDRRFLHTDPLRLVHRYRRRADREVAGFVASALAYGQVDGILAHAGAALRVMGPSPSRFVERFDARRDDGRFEGFVHRWTRGIDLAVACHLIQGMMARCGSIARFFAEGYRRGEGIRSALASFVRRALELDVGPFYPRGLPRRAGVRFLFPSPEAGSACKRLNLYLRWMVRRDGLDLGIWGEVDPADLVIPLDTHVARIAWNLGLTGRATPGWAMAEEVTAALRRLCPADPVRYDFALSRLGILDRCPRRVDRLRCARCSLLGICRL